MKLNKYLFVRLTNSYLNDFKKVKTQQYITVRTRIIHILCFEYMLSIIRVVIKYEYDEYFKISISVKEVL